MLAVLFLPLFVFLPKLIQKAMKADADAAIEAFGKTGQVKSVFWTFFVATTGLVLARVVDPVNSAGSWDYYGDGDIKKRASPLPYFPITPCSHRKVSMHIPRQNTRISPDRIPGPLSHAPGSPVLRLCKRTR